MIKNEAKTDYQIIADAFGVSVAAVRKALQRREEYPDNRLVKAYDKLQASKHKTIKKLTA